MRQTELSRELAALHDGQVQKKAIEQQESADETLQNEEKVARTAEIPQGPDQVNDDPDSAKDKKSPDKGKKRSGSQDREMTDEFDDEPKIEVVSDPLLGKNIDYSA